MVVLLEGVTTPEQSQELKQTLVLLPRSQFAKTAINEFYWVDLIGCEVVNLQGQLLGSVTQMDDHGAHSILVVAAASREEPHLIPFVNAYVSDVSLETRKIVVDWQNDY